MKTTLLYPARLATAYFVFSLLWILLTDNWLFDAFWNEQLIVHVSMYKGWLFVLLSTALIYFSLSQEWKGRLKAEQDLHEKAAQMRMWANTIEKSSQPFGSGLADGQMLSFNGAFCSLLGYDNADEMKTLNWVTSLTPPEWRAYEVQRQAELRQTGKPVRYQKELFRKNGSLVPVELFVHQEVDDQGNFLYFYSFVTDLTEQKKAEEALRQKTEELENFFQVNLDLLCIADTDGCFRKLNPQWEKTLGYTLQELEGHNFLDFVHPDDQQATQDAIGRLSNREMVLNFTNRYQCKDGSYRWIEWRSVPQGKIIYAAARDITERHHFEQALRESEKRFEEAFEYAPIGMALVSLDQYLVHVNRALCNILGYEKETLTTLSIPQITHPDDVNKEMLLKQDILHGGREYYQVEKRYLHVSGRIVWGLLSVSLMTDSHGEPLYYIGQVEDITERKDAEDSLRQAESALRESEYWLKESQRIAEIGSYVLDINTGQWQSSGVLDQIFGIGPDYDRSVEGWGEIIHPDHRDNMLTYLTNLLATQQKFDKEYRIISQSDGQERWVHGRGNFDYDENGRALRMYGTIQDITHRKQDELALLELNNALEERVRQRTAQLEASNHELEAFSYSVSHDLRAPLRHLDGYSRMLEETSGNQLGVEAQGYIKRIQDAAAHMGKLIDAMLNISHLSQSKLHIKTVNLSACAHTIASELSQQSVQRSVEFIIQDDLMVSADETLMCIVLENLLENAWKFSSKLEQVRIEFGRTTSTLPPGNIAGNKDAIFFVRDNGAGFDMAYVNKLFRAFQRLHQADEFPGTGIGLATVQRIIHRHGGQVWAESAPGQGATFFFTLPATSLEN